MLLEGQTAGNIGIRRLQRVLLVVLMSMLLGVATGCKPQPSRMAGLGVKSLGVVVATDGADYLEPVVTDYVRRRLPEITITGSQVIRDYLALPWDSGEFSLIGRVGSENLQGLQEDLGIEYLTVISIDTGESPRHTASITIGTEESELRLSEYKTVTLDYSIIRTSTNEVVFSGQTVGKSSDIADFQVGTVGTKVGIQLSNERNLLREATRNALEETNLF